MATRKLLGVLILLAVVFIAFPCCDGGGDGSGGNAGSQNNSGASGDSTAFLTGVWNGTILGLTEALKTWPYPLQLVVTQTGTSISGTASMGSSTETGTGEFSGTVSNPTGEGTINFTMTIYWTGRTLQYSFSGSYTATNMQGSWKFTAFPQGGSWSVDKD